ncbi:MAG: hypothetical protein KDB88_01975 [Flavobacteriales bacterium]|nr:hypothetical protein [Flavobacteriales bacterium]
MNKYLLTVVLACTMTSLMACDVCGVFLGIRPNDRSSSFGLFYRWRQLRGDLSPVSLLAKHGDPAPEGSAPQHYEEQFLVLEARGEVWLGQRWSILASVPVVNNYQSVDQVAAADVYGVADPFVLGRYVVVNTRGNDVAGRAVHRLSLGLGLKAPLGMSNVSYNGERVDEDLQPGTSTWDGLASVEYQVRRNALGASLAASGRFNTANDEGYQLGHGMGTTVEAFYLVGKEALRWGPSLGAYGEYTAKDQLDGTPVPYTGTSTLFSHLGSRVWWRNWMLSVYHQYAVSADNGALMVPNRQRLILGITYNLNKNEPKTR